MIRRTFSAALLVALGLGAIAVLAPTPAIADPSCVACPAIFIDCGPCGVLHPQTCNRCQFCMPIPNCSA